MTDSPILDAIDAWGGAARWSELRRAGISWRAIESAVESGALFRTTRGVVARPGCDPDVAAAARLTARLTCASALRALGIPTLEVDDRAHLATPSGSVIQRSDASVRLHRRPGTRRLGYTVSADVALEDAAGCLSDVPLLVAVDAAMHRGLIGADALMAMRRVTRARRRWLLENCDARAESPLETIARLELRRAGLGCRPQAPIPGVGRVDLLVEGRVVVELDGREYHSREAAFRGDRARDRRLVEQGFVVLRFTAADAMRQRGDIARAVRGALNANRR